MIRSRVMSLVRARPATIHTGLVTEKTMMTTARHVVLASRLVLAVCLVAGVLSGRVPPTGAASVASSSTWYWQNPLPHPYSVNAVACASVSHCVAVGNGGATLRTSDGGQHWTAGTVGAPISVMGISCPTAAVCYALGNTYASGYYTYHVLRSADGGVTWQESPLTTLEGATSITCPSAATCLMTGSASNGRPGLFRTSDSGRTWTDVLQGSRNISVSCPSSRVCYAGADVGGDSTTTLLAHAVYRSEDAGTTWQLWASQTEPDGTRQLNALTCPAVGRCLAAVNKTTSYVGDVFLIRSSGTTWTRVVHVKKHQVWWMTCGGRTACYAYVIGSGLFRSTEGGTSWKAVSLPTGVSLGGMACPTSRTCYAPLSFTVIKTTDGFTHAREMPATSPIGTPFLGSIQCPTRATCYAYGRTKGLVATTNGGHTWTVRPNLPIGYATLTCPSSTVCYVAGTKSNSPPWLVYRTRDGARHWQQLTLPAQAVSLTAPNCPTVETCYVGADLPPDSAAVPYRYRLLVTHDGGTTWSVKTAIDKVPGHSTPTGCYGAGCYIGGFLGAPSCPSVTTCFETVPTWTRDTTYGWVEGAVVATTRDGGNSWTVTGQCQSYKATGPQVLCGPLTCPTATSCYLLSVVPVPGGSSLIPETQLIVTHDGGASWQTAALGSSSYATAIACATAKTCRVIMPGTGITPTGIFATSDGGKIWQKQALPADVSGIACPGADTCYAVGGLDILATHRP